MGPTKRSKTIGRYIYKKNKTKYCQIQHQSKTKPVNISQFNPTAKFC